jgi:AraC-like DNA-binding protein
VAVLLDTTRMTPRQRTRAMTEFLEAQSMPMRFECSRPVGHMQNWSASWNLGSLQVLQAQGSAIRWMRGAREVDATPDAGYLVISYFGRGVTTGTRGFGEDEFTRREGDILLYDLTEPYGMDLADGYNAFGVLISHTELDLPVEVIRRAVRNAGGSPVHALLHRHIARICANIPSLQDNPAAAPLAAVTVDLTRTLIATAGGTPAEAADALVSTLTLRVERYVLEHLEDSSLSGARIAAAHYVSVRQLYYVWSAHHDESLAEWIMFQRLDRASRALAGGAGTIATVAHRFGFADATHFSRRFRERNGITPRDWRALWQHSERLSSN